MARITSGVQVSEEFGVPFELAKADRLSMTTPGAGKKTTAAVGEETRLRCERRDEKQKRLRHTHTETAAAYSDHAAVVLRARSPRG